MAHNYAPYFESVYGKTQEEMAQKPPYRVIESFKKINEIPEYWGLTAEEKTYTEYSEISEKVGTDTSAAGVIDDYPFVEEKLTETGKFTNAQKDSLALRSYILFRLSEARRQMKKGKNWQKRMKSRFYCRITFQ